MALDKAMQELKYDIRMQEWHIRTGKLTETELKQIHESLPDCSGNAVALALDERSLDDGFSSHEHH